MIKKSKFIDRTLFLLRKIMEENLPDEATLDEMIEKLNKLLRNFIK